MVEAREVSGRLFLRRTLALAGLSCFVLAQPRLARAQAEELPPEPAAKQNVPPPTQPSQASSQAMAAPQSTPAPNHQPTILFVPYLGFSLPVGDGWAGYKASPRFGALLGWHATERLCLGDSKGCSSFENHYPTSRQRAIVHGGRPVRAILGLLQGICGHGWAGWARLGSGEGPVASPRRSLPHRVPAEVAAIS